VSKPSGGDADEQSFAGLVNDLTGGPWRSGGRRKRSVKSSATPPPAAVDQQGPAQQQTSVAAGTFEWSQPAPAASVVRPYTWTGGRTAPVIDLAVAEVAALLSLPLGVIRVLLADMADIGLVVVHRSANGSSNTPDMALMERVLSGLRRL
jgi:hypothetical protein